MILGRIGVKRHSASLRVSVSARSLPIICLASTNSRASLKALSAASRYPAFDASTPPARDCLMNGAKCSASLPCGSIALNSLVQGRDGILRCVSNARPFRLPFAQARVQFLLRDRFINGDFKGASAYRDHIVNKVRANARRSWRLDARQQCFVDAKASLLEYPCRHGGRFLIGPLFRVVEKMFPPGSPVEIIRRYFLGCHCCHFPQMVSSAS